MINIEFFLFAHVEGRGYYDIGHNNVDWDGIADLLSFALNLVYDSETRKQKQSCSSGDAVQPTREGFCVAGIDDGWTNVTHALVSLSLFQDSFAQSLGEGVGVGVGSKQFGSPIDELLQRHI